MTSPTGNRFPSSSPTTTTTQPPTLPYNSRRTLSLFTEPCCDYFQYKPFSRSSTPSSPIDLLVATFDDININISPYTMDVSNILQLQTEAAHSSPRPIPQPLQTASLSSGTNSASSNTSSTSSLGSSSASNSRRLSRTTKPVAPPPVSSLKCTRCKRSVSVDSNSSSSSEVISFGTLHYCSSCATILEQRAI